MLYRSCCYYFRRQCFVWPFPLLASAGISFIKALDVASVVANNSRISEIAKASGQIESYSSQLSSHIALIASTV